MKFQFQRESIMFHKDLLVERILKWKCIVEKELYVVPILVPAWLMGKTGGYMGLVPVDQAMVISEDDYTWCGAPESDCVDFKFQD